MISSWAAYRAAFAWSRPNLFTILARLERMMPRPFAIQGESELKAVFTTIGLSFEIRPRYDRWLRYSRVSTYIHRRLFFEIRRRVSLFRICKERCVNVWNWNGARWRNLKGGKEGRLQLGRGGKSIRGTEIFLIRRLFKRCHFQDPKSRTVENCVFVSFPVITSNCESKTRTHSMKNV